MVNRPALLAGLKRQVALLEADLRERADGDDGLQDQWQALHRAGRTALPYVSWRDEQLSKAAMDWVLGSALVRFSEDNGLIEAPYIAGSGKQLALARRREAEFFRKYPHAGHRDWLIAAFEHLEDASGGLVAIDWRHPGIARPSEDASRALIDFWRLTDTVNTNVYDFTDPRCDTTFLSELYQGLSDRVTRNYALVMTPEFVVDFILDQTLTPAFRTFGLENLRVADPVCGSGQFLIGAFSRIVAEWASYAPGMAAPDRIKNALASVHGMDINRSAVTITRFRLAVAAIAASGLRMFGDAASFRWILNVGVGDSLLAGVDTPSQGGNQPSLFESLNGDESGGERVADLLSKSSYHVVVGQPPYLIARDKALSDLYRDRYDACQGNFPLAIPFTQRFYELAQSSDEIGGAGYVGQFTANSFMKRDFGRSLIEHFFASRVTLTHIIDTSGVYLPGHGTPTVILIGRNRPPRNDEPVLVVSGMRGEPAPSANPEQGHVWRSILHTLRHPGKGSEWTESSLVDRERFRSHPWNLAGSRVADVLQAMESRKTLQSCVQRIGYYAITGFDEVFVGPPWSFGIEVGRSRALLVPAIAGSDVRDWLVVPDRCTVLPRDDQGRVRPLEVDADQMKRLWPFRTVLGRRLIFGTSYFDNERPWYDWNYVADDRDAHAWSIVFSWVATHNHFALLGTGYVPLHSAPIIKLPKNATESDHVNLVALLNSSAACFWLKQHSNSKGHSRADRHAEGEPWADHYEFTSTRLRDLPLPQRLEIRYSAELAELARELAMVHPNAVLTSGPVTPGRLAAARERWAELNGRMVALQEELDWEVYGLYGLLPGNGGEFVAPVDQVPSLNLGERAFEIVLARRVGTGERDTSWFARHGSTPIVELPEHWPAAYRAVVSRRIDAIDALTTVDVIEQPEYKRRWRSDSWDDLQIVALRNLLLDRCAERQLWFAEGENGYERPRPMTVNQLADRLRVDEDVVQAAEIYSPGRALSEVLAELLDEHHVPYLAQLRYRESGLRKYAEWTHVWERQGTEDSARSSGDLEKAAKIRAEIQIPRSYVSTDFLKATYWRNRGKHDVPKERFISYPDVGPQNDNSLLLGWAGWDHRERVQVLIDLIEECATKYRWGRERLIPLLAGLAQELPWVRQWSGGAAPGHEGSPADVYLAYLKEQQLRYGISDEVLAALPATKPKRGRPRKYG